MLVKFSRNLNEMSWHIWHVCITVYCLGPYFRYFADHKRLCEDLFNIPILCGKKLRNGWDLRLRLWCDCGCGSSASTPFFKTIHFNKNWKVTVKANQGNFKHLTCSDYVKSVFLSNCRAQNTAETRLHWNVWQHFEGMLLSLNTLLYCPNDGFVKLYTYLITISK